MLPIGTDGDRPNIIRVSSQRRNNLYTFDTPGILLLRTFLPRGFYLIIIN
jgi:hypothetical protein